MQVYRLRQKIQYNFIDIKVIVCYYKHNYLRTEVFMDKKAWTPLGTLLIIATILISPLMDYVWAFLFAGIIPGTNYTLPFWTMSLILASIGIAAIRWLLHQPLFIGNVLAPKTQLAVVPARRTTRRRKSSVQKLASTRRTRKQYQSVSPATN